MRGMRGLGLLHDTIIFSHVLFLERVFFNTGDFEQMMNYKVAREYIITSMTFVPGCYGSCDLGTEV